MKYSIRIIIISVVSIVVLLGLFGCSSSVSNEEYDRVKNELDDAMTQVQALQEKLDDATILETQYQDLKNQYDAAAAELQTVRSDFDALNDSYQQLLVQDNARLSEIQGLEIDYDMLNQEFEELQKQYDSMFQSSTEFSNEEVDQAIFNLVNQERRNAGLDELEWGVNLYSWARQNSVSMSETGEFKYTSWLSTQAVLITSGQETFDGLVNGVMAVWKQQKHEFTPKFLSTVTKYGAVATYRLGDIYYITFLANIDP